MTGMYSAQTISGLAVQQRYKPAELSGKRSSGAQTRSTRRLTEDTVDISPQAYELFHAQRAKAATETERQTTATDQKTAAPGVTAEPSGSGTTVSDRIEEIEAEISSLKAEMTPLEEKSLTDDITASLLRSKQARLRILEAMLTGLMAKFMLPA